MFFRVFFRVLFCFLEFFFFFSGDVCLSLWHPLALLKGSKGCIFVPRVLKEIQEEVGLYFWLNERGNSYLGR